MSRYVNPVPQYYLNDGSVASSGKLYFYENKDPNTKKDTFSDPDNSIKNTNPVLLDGEGRCPPVFGDGLYTVVLKSNDNIQQWSRDDVDLTTEPFNQFSDWSATTTYRVNEIVRASDGNYYISIVNNNIGNDPVTSATVWEQLAFLTFWNSSKSYDEDDIVIFDGAIWSSNTDNNTSEPGTNEDWSSSLSNDRIELANGGSSTIDSGFNNTYFFRGSSSHSLTISDQVSDEGATETKIICQTEATSNILISLSGAVSATWSFSPTLSIDGYQLKPGETLRLVNTADKDTYVAYADNGISKVIPSIGGDFDFNQTIRLHRLGDIVTITSDGILSHFSSSAATSAPVIPPEYIPNNNKYNVYYIDSSGSFLTVVFSSGRFETQYFDWAGSAVSRTSTVSNVHITYDIKNA